MKRFLIYSTLLLLAASCASTKHVARFDVTMYQGLANVKTHLDTRFLVTPHAYDQPAYASEHAQIGTLLVQARTTPLNDSATIIALTQSDLALDRLQTFDSIGLSSINFLNLLREEIDAKLDAAIMWEGEKKLLPN